MSNDHDHDHGHGHGHNPPGPMVEEISDFEALEIAVRELAIEKGGSVRNSVCEAGLDFSTVRPAEGPSRP